MVSLQWVVESLLLGRPAPEADFPFQDNSSKDMLKAAMGSDGAFGAAAADDDEEYEEDLMEAYKNATATAPMLLGEPLDEKDDDDKDETVQFKVPNAINLASRKSGNDVTVTKSNDATVTQDDTAGFETTEQESQADRFLIGKRLYLSGFPTKTEQELSDWVNEAGGDIVYSDFDGVLDYLVLPPEGLPTGKARPFKAKEVVSSMWLEDALDRAELCDIEYFHRPLDGAVELREEKPCEGVVIGVSNYSGKERLFLTLVAETLGMIAQDVFAKRQVLA